MIRANHSQKRANNLKNSHFLYVFPLFTPKSKSFPSLFTKERLWAICLDPSCQKSNGNDELFFTGESLLRSQKTSDSLEKPMSEFPTLFLSTISISTCRLTNLQPYLHTTLLTLLTHRPTCRPSYWPTNLPTPTILLADQPSNLLTYLPIFFLEKIDTYVAPSCFMTF